MTEQKLLAVFALLLKTFRLKGEMTGYEIIKTGNINDTYVLHVKASDGRDLHYTVQRLNHEVFRSPEQVAENAFAVTTHIERKLRSMGETDVRRRVLRYYRMDSGKFFLQTPEGDYWRVFSYVYDAINTSEPDERILYGTGVAFGRFQRYLSDFPAEKLFTTIPDFHNTPKRFRDLHASAEADVCGRAAQVGEELSYLFSMERYVSLFDDLHRAGEMPLRVVHNDTKCNNVMFDRETLEPLAVIDLDTVMPGFVTYDFGDAVRFACNTAAEDAQDVSAVSLDLNGYRRFAEGFLAELRGIMTETELVNLPKGVLIVTLELAARFLKDYLDGDVYFKCRKQQHNLLRARCQIALAKDIVLKLPEMDRLLVEIVEQKPDRP